MTRYCCDQQNVNIIGHFQKPSLLKRGQVQNLSCENEFYLHDNKKIIFIGKVLHLASF